MATWTINDRDRIIEYLNLTLDSIPLIERTLTNYEAVYGSSAIVKVQAKLTSLDSYKATISGYMTGGELGITSITVPSFYSITKSAGSDLRATMALSSSAKQWLITNLRLQNYASLSSKQIRA